MIELNFKKFVENRNAFKTQLPPEVTFIFLTLLAEKEYADAKGYLASIDYTIDYQAVLVALEKQNWVKIVENGVVMRTKWYEFQPAQSKTKAKISEWIGEYAQLFDEANKHTRYEVSADAVDCLKKMSKFVQSYRYEKEVIFDATRRYLQDMQNQNYTFMRSVLTFIHHPEKGSLLATYCKKIVEGEPEQEQVKFSKDDTF